MGRASRPGRAFRVKMRLIGPRLGVGIKVRSLVLYSEILVDVMLCSRLCTRLKEGDGGLATRGNRSHG